MSIVEIPRLPTTPQIDPSIEVRPKSWWRNASKYLFFFETAVLGTAWQDKFRNFGILQKKLCNFLQNRHIRKKFVSVFRGSFKTTVILGFCLWLFTWAIAENKPLSVCYNTSSKDNAQIFMEDFRQTLVKCWKLHWIFPEVPKKESTYLKWTKTMVEYGEAKFHVSSLDTRQVMRHYQVIINDDLVNDDNAFSETERQTVIRKWKLQKSILTRYKMFDIGTEIDVGTPYHHKDLISHIMTRVKTYEKFVIPFELDGMITMPEMYCREDFEEKRAEMGPSLFATQYELKVIDDQDKLCDESQLAYWRVLPTNRQRIAIIDPGGIEDKDDPSTGAIIFDVDPAGYLYAVYAQEHALSPFKLIRLMEDLKGQYDPDEIYMEREKYSITIADTIEHLQTKLNFSFVNPRGRDKDSRIFRLKQYIETGRFLIGRGMTVLEDRLTNYPDCPKHLLDAAAYVLDVMNPPKKGIEREEQMDQDKLSDFEDELKKVKHLQGRYQEVENNDWLF
jgi:hypothetical protein